MQPHHALMQELATVRRDDLLREAKADRAAAAAEVATGEILVGDRMGVAAARLVFALRRRAAVHPAPSGA